MPQPYQITSLRSKHCVRITCVPVTRGFRAHKQPHSGLLTALKDNYGTSPCICTTIKQFGATYSNDMESKSQAALLQEQRGLRSVRFIVQLSKVINNCHNMQA